MSLSPTIQARRDLALKDFFFFAKYILGYGDLVKRVHGPICEVLQNLLQPRVNVTLPRKFFKTTLAAIAYPLWRAVTNPNVTIILGMNTARNAALKLDELKGHVESNQIFRACFPEIVPDFNKSRWGAEAITLRRPVMRGAPTLQAVGAATTVISQAVDEIVMDDILTATQDDVDDDDVILPSGTDIQRAIRWYKGTISLIKDPKRGRIINVGTRWAEKDLVEHVLRTNAQFRANNIELRALDEAGNPTFPERYDAETLQEVENTLGTTVFRLWYMNEPIDPAELVFRLDSERDFYRPALMPEGWIDRLRVYSAVDLAFSDSERADNTSILTLGVDDHNIRYVLDLQYGKFEPDETIERLFGVNARFRPRVMGIEAVAGQILMTKLLPHFMRERNEYLPIVEIKRGGKKAKEQRIAMGIQPWLQQGLVKLPFGMVKPLEREMRDFRYDERRRGHDDALDTLADALQLSTAARPVSRPQEKRIRTPEEWLEIKRKLYDLDAVIEERLKPPAGTRFTRQMGRMAYLGN